MDKTLLKIQREEITQHIIYNFIYNQVKKPNEKSILKNIAKDELTHYHFWKTLTKQEVKPNYFKIFKYKFLSRIFGITFSLRSLENEEKNMIPKFNSLIKKYPTSKKIIYDSEKHEEKLISLINEERLNYLGAIILGINDALVELTGALAGFTLALKNSHLIAITGIITGIAAALSMAASEYLSAKSEPGPRNAKKAAIYTGIAYLFTVLFLVTPYIIFNNIYVSLISMMFNAIIIIFIFTYYLSIAKKFSFRRKFSEMALISLGVAAISFFIGFIINHFFGIPV